MLALAILTSTVVAVMLVAWGGQSLLFQSEADAGAVVRAQASLERLKSRARSDFRLANNQSAAVDGAYSVSIAVDDVLFDPFTTKRARAQAAWSDQSGSVHSVTLTELLSDYTDPSTLDTCDPELVGDWRSPRLSSFRLATGNLLPAAPAGHTFSATNPITALDAYHGRLYVAVGKTASASNDSLFIFDSSDPHAKPRYLGSIDTNTAVIEGPSSLLATGNHLLAANTHVSNFKTCKPSANCSQLQIFDVTDPSALPAPVNYLVPTSSMPFVTGTSSSQALGNALYYRDGYAYLGLTKTGTGPEFNIIDVHDFHSPRWIGGFPVGASINAIYVRGGYAYLATDDRTRELIVLDIRDPSHPKLSATFDPSGTLGFEVGKSIYRRGDDLLFGMSAASGSPELYGFSIRDPAGPIKTGQYTDGSTILDIYQRDSILFTLASTYQQLQMLDVSNISAIHTLAAPLTLPGTGSALDCEGNYFYIGSNAGVSASISIVGPAL